MLKIITDQNDKSGIDNDALTLVLIGDGSLRDQHCLHIQTSMLNVQLQQLRQLLYGVYER